MSTEEKDMDDEAERKHPVLWGVAYIILGLIGLCFSAYALIGNMGIVPLYGAVTAGVLVGAISLLLIAYGYRIMRKDY
jgi:hypothetical protein